MKWVAMALVLSALAPLPGWAADYRELAFHWAPVIYHGTASDQDYITRVDFDGDWIGNNNWENQPHGDLSAHVYYSVIETETHYFLFFGLFHPRDYEPWCFPSLCHENDMESIQLVVRKDGSEWGRLEALETLAHNRIYLYVADYSVKGGFLRVRGRIITEDGRPVIYVETYGHGIYGHKIKLKKGTVIYRPGEVAEVPEGNNGEVTYALVPIYDTLWQHRDEIGPGKLFDQPFEYRGVVLGAAFDGDDWGEDKANSPWGYPQALGTELSRGDWFLDPAKALAYHATFPEPYSTAYLFNPYLEDLGPWRP